MNAFRIAFAVFLVLHGVAHGVGFAAPWQLGDFADTPVDTTLLGGRVDVGVTGARAMGVVWLLTGLTFVVAAAGLWTARPWWSQLTAGVVIVSLALSLLAWPGSRIGVAVNLAVLGVLVLGARFDWLGGVS